MDNAKKLKMQIIFINCTVGHKKDLTFRNVILVLILLSESVCTYPNIFHLSALTET